MNYVSNALFHLNAEEKAMYISLNASSEEILEAQEIAKLFGLTLEFVLDEF